jgi:hypothetical protein
MRRKLKPEITKPYRIRLQVDNKPLIELPKHHWYIRVADPTKSFTFSAGTEMQAMHLWRTQCSGSEILSMVTYKPTALLYGRRKDNFDTLSRISQEI